jgi:hypothetical protein
MVDGTAKRSTFPGLVWWHSPVLHFRCLGWIDCQHPRLDGRIVRIPSHFTSSLVNMLFKFKFKSPLQVAMNQNGSNPQKPN